MMNIFEEAYRGIQEAKKAYATATNTAEQDAARAIYKQATAKLDGLSSTEQRIWSAYETAWLFQKAGCTLAGLIEINSQHKAFMSDEYEKTHGYLFKLN